MTEPPIKERLMPRFSLKRPVTVVMILVAVLVIGAIAYNRIKLDLFPAGFSNPYLGIWIPYIDANPGEIEEQIVKPVEGELKTVKNLKRVFSNSSSRGCWFWLEFSQGTNMDLAYAQVTDRLERARPLIPDEIEHFYVRRFRVDDEPIIFMGVSFHDGIKDPHYVTERFIKQSIEGVKGVANVELFGMREKYIQIIVDNDKVRNFRVNLVQLMNKLVRDNFAISSGTVYMGGKKYLVRSKSRFQSLEQIRNIEIRPGLRLHNIAEVVYDFEEEQDNIMRVDGKLAGGLVAYKESEANTVEVCRLIHEKLEEQFASRPELKGVNYFVFFDQGTIINESIENVKVTAMWGGLFAFFVLLLFLRKLRITIMLTLAIPLSLLVSVLILYAMNWTLNLFTMMGLMLSIGLVVDNAIVITENIYRFNGMGLNPKRSAILGASEVGLAITLATLTTVVVFLPLMIMGGDSNMSFFITRIGLPVVFALLASLFIALLFIPLGSTRAIPKKLKTIQATHSRFTQSYQNALVKVLKHRGDALIVIFLIILSQIIPMNLVKKTDTAEGGPRDAKVICNFPSSYSLQKADQTVNYIVKRIKERGDIYHIDHISTRVRPFWGLIEIYLKPDRDRQWHQVVYRKIVNLFGLSGYRRLNRQELTEDIKQNLPEIPGVRLRTSWRDQGGVDSSALTYILRGYDTGVLEELADELERQVRLVDGILSVETDVETGNDEIHIEVDRDKAFKVGVNPDYLAQYVAFTLRRRKISNYQAPGQEIPIYVKSRPEQREYVAQLKNTFIKTAGGAETNLAALVDLTYHRSFGNIRRENSKSFLEMKIFSGEEDMKKITGRIEQIFKNFKFPTGYYYEKGQRSRRLEQQNKDFMNALLLSVTFVFIIMGVLFESFILPLSILVAIPAAFVGSFWLLFISGTTLDIMAMIGLVILVGVVVNNAIVLIDLINQYRNTGMTREQAILVAGMHRFRPILMTALTTICGLLPMAIGNTALIGIPYAPLGIAMIGGLISSTFLTLFAVPIFYTYFDDLRQFGTKLIRKF
jgi:HAE1 family hydrophobic/amphiphilic exporter-1